MYIFFCNVLLTFCNHFSDGCLAHKTGVACGALVMYLRYLIDPGPMDLLTPHDFFPEGPEEFQGEDVNKNSMLGLLNKTLKKFDDLHSKEEEEGTFLEGAELIGKNSPNLDKPLKNRVAARIGNQGFDESEIVCQVASCIHLIKREQL